MSNVLPNKSKVEHSKMHPTEANMVKGMHIMGEPYPTMPATHDLSTCSSPTPIIIPQTGHERE
jgi:hypothetical protein